MRLKKCTIMLDHGMYGRPEVPAYAFAGLAVHKRHRGWAVTHIASGSTVAAPVGRDWPTKARAAQQLAELVALPIDWHLPFDQIRQPFRDHAEAIRKSRG